MDKIKERLRGIALGAAVGDALGMPLEFFPPRNIYISRPRWSPDHCPREPSPMIPKWRLPWRNPCWRTHRCTAQDLAQRFTDWYHASPPDIGIHTSHVLGLIAAGRPGRMPRHVQSGHPESASNGSLMRCWPVSIAYWNNPELLLSESRLQSAITHTPC